MSLGETAMKHLLLPVLLIAAALFVHNKHVNNEARKYLISMT